MPAMGSPTIFSVSVLFASNCRAAPNGIRWFPSKKNRMERLAVLDVSIFT